MRNFLTAAAKVASLAALIASAAMRGLAGAQATTAACGPFGSPPVKLLGAVKPACADGERLGPWKDTDGTDRYACLYDASSAKPGRRLPLLVYLHPSLFGPWTIRHTNLLDLRATTSLSGEHGDPGYIVLAPQGRNTAHYYQWPDDRGMGWDNWYRQLSAAGNVKVGKTVYPENVDAATIDHFIAAAARTGRVDTRRIYVTGWSNGAAMGLLYALNRPNVAAVAVYSGPDPFGALVDPCHQKPVSGKPASDAEVQIYNERVPVMLVHNSCDIAGICPNGEKLATELRDAGAKVDDVIVDASGKRVEACLDACGADPNGGLAFMHHPGAWLSGLHHHGEWPDEWTTAMLEFLRAHPLHPSAPPF